MIDSQPFDPLKIGRYTVIRVHYEYAGQPPGEKLFVVLRHDRFQGEEFCWCIKATSKTERYFANKNLLTGCVYYKAGAPAFFNRNTIIDPDNPITMLYTTLEKAAKSGRYKIEGKMPADFHGKIVAAIMHHPVIEPKNKAKLLECIGEKIKP